MTDQPISQAYDTLGGLAVDYACVKVCRKKGKAQGDTVGLGR